MHRKLMGAVVTAVVFAAPVWAQEEDLTGSTEVQTEVETEIQTETEPGTGGSGELDTEFQTDDDDVTVQGSVETDESELQEDDVYGGSGEEGTTDVTTTTTQVVVEEEEERNDMRGVVVTLGGGFEGYTGDLNDALDTGGAWGVSAAIKPTRILGLELGYTGAANGLDGTEGNADVIRNGAHALATVGITPTAVQPYLLAGVGLSRYSVRAEASGLNDDWAGAVPVGVGLRTHIGDFTADLRGTYSMLFSQDLVPSPAADDFFSDGRWGGTLQLGATF